MSNLTLRTVKDSPLTNQEVDNNFVTLNTDKHENGSSPSYQNITAVSLSATGPVTGSNLNVFNWNTAYSWGDHAAAGYLSSASLGDYATEAYVNTQISNLVDTAPATLDTLNELAAALGDDPNFATTVSNSIGTKWTQDNTKISNWDTAYGWGNHASAGYLTSYTESDPTVPAHVKSITTIEKTNWNTAYGWGDHSTEGYLTTYTETDPTVPAHVKSITTTEKSNWNTAYTWGDHSTEGYLTTYVETDPTVPAHVKLITETQKANWNTAYGWGDHAAAGYLTTYTETDPTVPAHVKSITTIEKTNWNTAYTWGNHASAGYLASSSYTASDVLTKIKTVDGSGSGLDADTLDGLQPNVNASNNTIVQRHSSGYIFANYFNTTANDVSSGVTSVMVETGNDNYIRHGKPSAIASFLDGITVSGATATRNGHVAYYYNPSNMTPVRGDASFHVFHMWTSSPTITLTNSSFTTGDVCSFHVMQAADTVTVNATRIYLPNGSYDNSITFTGPGSFSLFKYTTTAGYWMATP